MKLTFYLEDYTLVYEQEDAISVPRIGENVVLDEDFFVESVIYYPKKDQVVVILTDEPPKKIKVAESKKDVVQLNDITQAKADAKQALKETDRLKRDVFSIRNYLKADKESKKT